MRLDETLRFFRAVRAKLAGRARTVLGDERVARLRKRGRSEAKRVVDKFFEHAHDQIAAQHERVIKRAIEKPFRPSGRPRYSGTAAAGTLGLMESVLTYGHPIGGIAGAVATAVTNGLLQTFLGASVVVKRMREAGREPTVATVNSFLAKTWGEPSPLFRREGFATDQQVRRQAIASEEEVVGALLDHLKEGVTEEVVGALLVVMGSATAMRRTWKGIKELEVAPLD